MEMAGLPYTVLTPKDGDEFMEWANGHRADAIMDCRYASSPSGRMNYGIGEFVWFEMEVIKYGDTDEPANVVAVSFANRDAEIREEQEREKQLREAYERVAEANMRNELIYEVSSS